MHAGDALGPGSRRGRRSSSRRATPEDIKELIAAKLGHPTVIRTATRSPAPSSSSKSVRRTAWRACRSEKRGCSCASRTPTPEMFELPGRARDLSGRPLAVRERRTVRRPAVRAFRRARARDRRRARRRHARRGRSDLADTPIPYRQGGWAMGTAEAAASAGLLLPPLTEEDAARSRIARVSITLAGTAGAGICCGCWWVPASSRCSGRTTGRA